MRFINYLLVRFMFAGANINEARIYRFLICKLVNFSFQNIQISAEQDLNKCFGLLNVKIKLLSKFAFKKC